VGDVGDLWRDVKEARKILREMFGVNCPVCTVKLPKAQPTILLPQQRCRVCKYVDPRPRLDDDEAEK
jgi:hypothetical protein